LNFVVDRIGLEKEKQLEINYNQRQTSIENNKPLLSMSAYFDVIKEFLVPITGRERENERDKRIEVFSHFDSQILLNKLAILLIRKKESLNDNL